MPLNKNSLATDFENFLRHDMPRLLHLSDSKAKATRLLFTTFAVHLRRLERSNPEELHYMLTKFCETIESISKWRRPPQKTKHPKSVEVSEE